MRTPYSVNSCGKRYHNPTSDFIVRDTFSGIVPYGGNLRYEISQLQYGNVLYY